MSCIATLRHDDTIYMACDSAWTFEEGIILTGKDPRKIIEIPIEGTTERVLVGMCGDGGILCRLDRELDGYTITEGETIYTILNTIDDCMQEHKLWDVFEMRTNQGSDIVLAMGGSVYRVFNRHSCVEIDSEFVVIGAGDRVAYGALFSLRSQIGTDTWADTPLRHLETAMQAAAEFDTSVRAPFHFFTTRPTAVDKEINSG